MLVLIAVTAVFILSYAFLQGNSISTTIGQNVNRHAKARGIAESALVMAISEVQSNSDWRTDYTHGAWVTDESYGGGTFTIIGEDGQDTDGDDTISIPAEGDGDLDDDGTDPLTLTAIGAYDGVTHTVRARVDSTSLMEVRTIAVAETIEVSGDGIVDSWESAQGSYAATKASAAILSTNSISKDKIKVKDSGIIKGDVSVGVGGNIGTVIKLKDSGMITGTQNVLAKAVLIPGIDLPTLGANVGDVTYSGGTTTISSDLHCDKLEIKNSAVVQIDGDVTIHAEDNVNIKDNGELQLQPGAKLGLYVGPSDAEFKVEDDAKVNTSLADPRQLAVYLMTSKKVEITGDAQIYATFVVPSSEFTVKDRAHVYGSFLGKKFKIEKDGQFHHDVSPASVLIGNLYRDLGGADFGLAAADQIEISDDGVATGFGGTARVSTNSTSKDKIKVKDGGIITGDVFVGPSGDPNTVVKTEKGGQIIGPQAAAENSVTILVMEEPTLAVGNSGNVTYSSGTTTISTDLHVDSMSITDDAIVEISGDVTILVEGPSKNKNFTTEDTAELRLLAGASLLVYTKGEAKFITDDDSQINTNTADPTVVTIYHGSSKGIELKGRAKVYATVIVPEEEFIVKDDAQFYGTVRADKITVEKDGQAHVSFGKGEGPADFGGDVVPFAVIWVERP